LEHVDGAARVGLVVVPLVGTRPSRRQPGGRRVHGILDLDRRLLDGRVFLEVGTDQPAVPRPRVATVGRGVNADEAAAIFDIALECVLLVLRAEWVSGGRQEYHDVVLREVGVREQRVILGRVDREVVFLAQLLNGRNAVGYRRMPKAGGLGEHQRLERWRIGRRGGLGGRRLCGGRRPRGWPAGGWV